MDTEILQAAPRKNNPQEVSRCLAMASRGLAVASDLLADASGRIDRGDLSLADHLLRAGLDTLHVALASLPSADA